MKQNKLKKAKYKSTQDVINTAASLAASILTGNVGGMITSVSPLLFALKGRFFKPLQEEYTKLEDKGLIPEDYFDTEQCKTGIQELLDSIENDMLDENLFNAMKRIFLVAATEKYSDRLDFLPLEYLRICRELSPGEVILLLANYKIVKDNKWEYTRSITAVHNWVSLVVANSQLRHGSLVLFHEKGLMEKQLIKGRVQSDKSGVGLDRKTFRLTDFGFALCEYIENYDSIIEDVTINTAENNDK